MANMVGQAGWEMALRAYHKQRHEVRVLSFVHCLRRARERDHAVIALIAKAFVEMDPTKSGARVSRIGTLPRRHC
jgi:hypothetical protein